MSCYYGTSNNCCRPPASAAPCIIRQPPLHFSLNCGGRCWGGGLFSAPIATACPSMRSGYCNPRRKKICNLDSSCPATTIIGYPRLGQARRINCCAQSRRNQRKGKSMCALSSACGQQSNNCCSTNKFAYPMSSMCNPCLSINKVYSITKIDGFRRLNLPEMKLFKKVNVDERTLVDGVRIGGSGNSSCPNSNPLQCPIAVPFQPSADPSVRREATVYIDGPNLTKYQIQIKQLGLDSVGYRPPTLLDYKNKCTRVNPVAAFTVGNTSVDDDGETAAETYDAQGPVTLDDNDYENEPRCVLRPSPPRKCKRKTNYNNINIGGIYGCRPTKYSCKCKQQRMFPNMAMFSGQRPAFPLNNYNNDRSEMAGTSGSGYCMEKPQMGSLDDYLFGTSSNNNSNGRRPFFIPQEPSNRSCFQNYIPPQQNFCNLRGYCKPQQPQACYTRNNECPTQLGVCNNNTPIDRERGRRQFAYDDIPTIFEDIPFCTDEDCGTTLTSKNEQKRGSQSAQSKRDSITRESSFQPSTQPSVQSSKNPYAKPYAPPPNKMVVGNVQIQNRSFKNIRSKSFVPTENFDLPSVDVSNPEFDDFQYEQTEDDSNSEKRTSLASEMPDSNYMEKEQQDEDDENEESDESGESGEQSDVSRFIDDIMDNGEPITYEMPDPDDSVFNIQDDDD